MGLAAVHCKAVVLSWFIVDFLVVGLNVWTLFCYTVLRQNKKISLFQVTGVKILVLMGTYIFFLEIFLCIFKIFRKP